MTFPLTNEQLEAYINVLEEDMSIRLRSDMTPFAIAILIDYVIVNAGLNLERRFTDEYLNKIKDWGGLSYWPTRDSENNG